MITFTGPNGEKIRLRDVPDTEYARAKSMLHSSIDICPTCGGRLEYVVPGHKVFVGRTYTYQGKEVKCDCRLQMALQIRYLLAGIGNEYWALNWDDDFEGDPGAKEEVNEYLRDWEFNLARGMGIMFSSPTQGVGKTWGAIHIGKEMIKKGKRVMFIDFPRMVSGLVDPDTKQQMEKRLEETTYVILDDIRAGISERQTDLYAMAFESVIRHRTMFNQPTLITSNLTEAQFEEHFPRISSLLIPKQIWIAMDGADYRRSAKAEEIVAVMRETKEIHPIV